MELHGGRRLADSGNGEGRETHRLFVDIINHRSGVEKLLPSEGNGRGRRKKRLSDRVGFDRVVNSSICKTDSPRPFPLHLLLILATERSSRTPPSLFFSPLFFPLLLLLLLYPSLFFPFISRHEREINSWNRSAMPSRSPWWW